MTCFNKFQAILSSPSEEMPGLFQPVLADLSCSLQVETEPHRAAETAASSHVDLLVLDIAHGESAFSACQHFLAAKALDTTALVFLSSNGVEAAAQERAFELGAADFLSLPFNSRLIRARLGSHLAHIQRVWQLQSALDQAQHLGFSHAHFFCHLQHELKTPLNSILGFSDVLSTENFGSLNERQMKFISHIHESGKRLLHLFESMQELADTEFGETQRLREPYSPEQQIQSVLGLLNEKMFRHQIRVETHFSQHVKLVGDYHPFKRMMFHLLFTVMKSVPNDSVLQLHGQAEPSGLTVVLDTPDLRSETLKRSELSAMPSSQMAFDPQVGMALVRSLAETQGGHLTVDTQDRAGVCFRIFVPSETASLDKKRSYPMRHFKILVIEDNPMNLELVQDVLTDEDFTVITAQDAVSGIELARAEQPDVILMDIQLPGMDGLQATQLLKEDDATRDIPVVALTAHAMQQHAAQAEDSGCFAFITKPINAHTLAGDVRRIIEKSAMALGAPAC